MIEVNMQSNLKFDPTSIRISRALFEEFESSIPN